MFPYTESLMDPKNSASKRVSRACDRCRLKKTKCDGRRCCNRCLADDAICIFSKRKRSSDRPYSPEYVQLLEDQQMKLVEGVQELYRRLRRGEGWTGPKIDEDSQGYPLVQDVLDSLSVLAPSERKPGPRSSDLKINANHDDEVSSNHYDQSTRHESSSPPPTPPDCSQSSATSSPIGDYPIERRKTAYMTPSFPQLATKPMPVGSGPCAPSQLLTTMIADGSEYWPTPSSYGGPVGHADFQEMVNPFHNASSLQDNCHWYPASYPMM